MENKDILIIILQLVNMGLLIYVLNVLIKTMYWIKFI